MTQTSITETCRYAATSSLDWVVTNGKNFASSASQIASNVWTAVSDFFTQIIGGIAAGLSFAQDFVVTSASHAKGYLSALPKEAWGGAAVGAGLTVLAFAAYKHFKGEQLSPVQKVILQHEEVHTEAPATVVSMPVQQHPEGSRA